MAALGLNLVTMADVAKSENKAIGSVAEVMLQTNQMLKDIPYMEMNMGTYHEESIRSGLPEVFYRKANEAIPPTKSTIEERKYQGAYFESKSQMDEKVAERGGPSRLAFNRWNQATGHIQSHANELASLSVYGSPLDSNRKTPGFFDVLSTLASSEPTSKQIISAGGSGSDNASILIVHWGPQSVFGVYPAGTVGGLKRTDRSPNGQKIKFNALTSSGSVGEIWGYEEQFEVNHGLVIKDYRQCARVANIDVPALRSNLSSIDLTELMIRAIHRIHNKSNGKGVIYVNDTIETYLDLQARKEVGGGGGFNFQNYQGEEILHFRGYPIRRMDAMLNSEDAVTA